MLRVVNVVADRSLGGPPLFWQSLPGMLADRANRAVVTATRPPALAALSAFSALLVSVTALAPESSPSRPHTIAVALTGNPPSVLRIDADTLFHTIDADFFLQDDGGEYVQTGDIPAMWLRDSSAQTYPYIRFADEIPALRPLVRAVIERNARNVLTDAHANAFTAGYKIWEEKWEPDSLAYPVLLTYAYWLETHDRTVFTPHLRWALEHTLATYSCEIHHDVCSAYRSRFLPNRGAGADFTETGMIWGAFRPSDDPVKYPFNIPQNMLAVDALDELGQIATDGFGDPHMAAGAYALATSVRAGIERHGVIYDFNRGWMYAYEVDGLGGFELMDDANLPNLVSAPLWQYVSPEDAVYKNTRAFALSSGNPYYYSGRYASGLGSPHTKTGWVWPLGMMAQALTSQDRAEVARLITTITATSGVDGLIHESFDPDDPNRFTRSEFGWANATYAELLFRSVAGIPSQPSHRDLFPHLLSHDPTPITVDSFTDQLRAEGTLTFALRQSVF